MIEINLNFVLFEELQEKPDSAGALTRIVVIRESKNSDSALDDGAANFYPLD
jgi:hypothetical protein